MKAQLFECPTCGAFYTLRRAEVLEYQCRQCGDGLNAATRLPDSDDPWEKPELDGWRGVKWNLRRLYSK